MDSANNVLSSVPTTTSLMYDWRIWTAVGIFIVIVIGYTYIQYTAWSSSPWFSERYQAGGRMWDWLPRWFRNDDLSNNLVSLETAESMPMPPPPPSSPGAKTLAETVGAPRETWCLVGEDLAGRYCVKVPGPQSCTHDRSYLSFDQCTLTPAMYMPAAVLKH